MKTHNAGGLLWRQRILLLILPVLFAAAALCIGRMQIHPADVLSAIGAKLSISAPVDSGIAQIIWSIRFPRVILAMLVGAGLSVAGCAFQSLFANPLATPDTLGVASGASFGAALGILLGFGFAGLQLTSLLFGIGAVVLTYFAGAGKGRNVNSFVLSGIMIGSLFSALLSLVKFTADTESQLPSITYFLMGSLGGKDFSSMKLGAPLILSGIAILYLLRWRLNVLPLGEDEAKATGTNIKALRIVTVLCATAVTAACVSLCGQVGWVGLLVPHLCRMRLGANNTVLIPACVSLGACFMLVVDTAARSITAAELPVSILTAIVGAPFFILLMRRHGRWRI